MPVPTGAAIVPQSPIVRVPGIGDVDMSQVRSVAPQIQAARAVFPAITSGNPRNTTALSGMRVMQVQDKTSRQTVVAASQPVDMSSVPQPLSRLFAFADLQKDQVEKSEMKTRSDGNLAPGPILRADALIKIAPVPSVMTSVASLSTVDLDMSPKIALNRDLSAGARTDLAPILPSSLEIAENTDLALSAPENSLPSRMLVADPAPEVPRRLVIEVPDVKKVTAVAEPDTAPAFSAPTVPSIEDAARIALQRNMAAIAIARASPQVARLGRVSFDDRYAQPAGVDFNDGRAAGRLQNCHCAARIFPAMCTRQAPRPALCVRLVLLRSSLR